MNTRIVIISIALAACGFAQQSRLRPTSEAAVDLFASRPRVIVPGLMIYGVPWTASIEEFKTAFGAPTGIFSIRTDAVALVYGKTHVLLFEAGELREVSIDLRLLNYALEAHVLPHPFFDARDLSIAPGIKLGMSPHEILALVPGKFAVPTAKESVSSCVLDHASLTLRYAMRYGRDAEAGTKSLMSVTIRGL